MHRLLHPPNVTARRPQYAETRPTRNTGWTLVRLPCAHAAMPRTLTTTVSLFRTLQRMSHISAVSSLESRLRVVAKRPRHCRLHDSRASQWLPRAPTQIVRGRVGAPPRFERADFKFRSCSRPTASHPQRIPLRRPTPARDESACGTPPAPHERREAALLALSPLEGQQQQRLWDACWRRSRRTGEHNSRDKRHRQRAPAPRKATQRSASAETAPPLDGLLRSEARLGTPIMPRARRARQLPSLPSLVVLVAVVLSPSLLLTPSHAQPSANLNTYPVNWTAVPIARQQPKNLTANCICDVTENVCNPSCCCDPLCPEGLVNETKDEGRCLPEGPPDQTLDFCVPQSSVQKVRVTSKPWLA
eukprot:351970-Chlamydomonas_euryale.AAC.4